MGPMRRLLWVTMFLVIMLAIASSEAKPTTPTFLTLTNNSDISALQTLKVFEQGVHKIADPITINKNKSSSCAPPEPLYIVSPKEAGVYPILFFVHGTMIRNQYYSDLFKHIASHGVIVVAPQLWSNPLFLPNQQEEIDMAASVINWLSPKLQGVLPAGVTGDLSRLAVSGHSRGGKTAFALALGKYSETKLNLNIAALIGVDPVAGTSKDGRTKPHILNFEPNSFKLSMPVTVIGTGLGNHSKFLIGGACAPNGVSHDEFYNECPKCSHFVIKDYGHMDMVDENIPLFDLTHAIKLCCESNFWGSKRTMRRTVGGIMVAFLDAYLGSDPDDYKAILANPSVAPATLLPVQEKAVAVPQYAQV